MRSLLRPLVRHCHCGSVWSCAAKPINAIRLPSQQQQQRRTFLTGLPLSSNPSTQSISATRTLPYTPTALYKIISDIDAYSSFLPYVLDSKVVERHPITSSPTYADLRIGFTPIDENFRSKVTCVEPSVVEADASGNGVFETLKTRWEIHPTAGLGVPTGEAAGSVVNLKIDYGFSNPLYAALTQAVVPKVATVMIDAFEKRAKELLEKKDDE